MTHELIIVGQFNGYVVNEIHDVICWTFYGHCIAYRTKQDIKTETLSFTQPVTILSMPPNIMDKITKQQYKNYFNRQ